MKAWTHHVQMHSIRNRHQASLNTATHKISLTAVPGYHRSFSKGCRCWWWRCSLASCRCRSGTRARSRRRSWAAPSGWASSRTRGIPCPCRWGGSSSRPASRSQCPSSQTSPHLPGNIDFYVNTLINTFIILSWAHFCYHCRDICIYINYIYLQAVRVGFKEPQAQQCKYKYFS